MSKLKVSGKGKVPESRCLNCGHLMNTVATDRAGVEAKPEPGDNAVCLKCGAVMKLDENLRVRGMTDAEMDELVADHETMDEVARMVQKIHFLKHRDG